MLSPQDMSLSQIANFPPEFNWPQGHSTVIPSVQKYGSQKIVCHKCGVDGHKSTYC
jgi:hypothetical protein